MHKFVITGGPCGGKTTLMSHLKQELEERGYKVITVPESAGELIANGVAPSDKISMLAFQSLVLALQISKEDLFAHAHNYYDTDKVVVLCDRGIVDICEHMDVPKFEKMIAKRGLTLEKAYERYDAVFHMVTTADGAEEYYMWDDPAINDAIDDVACDISPEDARRTDKKIIDAWSRHPNAFVFDNSTDFEDKLMRVLTEVCVILGEPLPNETLRKFLVKKPTQNELNRLKCTSVTQIVQTYLNQDGDTVRKIRQRGSKESGYSFYYAEQDVNANERAETEDMITASEYIAYLSEVDASVSQLSKTRYSFVYDQHCFDLDVYPFSKDYAILEIEVENVKEQIIMPPLQVVADVTGDPNYLHYSLAKTQTLACNVDNMPVQEKVAPKLEKKAEALKAEKKPETLKQQKVEQKTNAPKVEKKPEMIEKKPEPQKKEADTKKPEQKRETKPTEIKQTETKPVETKNSEAKPTETKPVTKPTVEHPTTPKLPELSMMFEPPVMQKAETKQTHAKIKNKTTDALETVLNQHGFTAKQHYSLGGAEEHKVCMQASKNGFEVFSVEKGRKVDVTEHADIIDACIAVIRQISYDGKQIKSMFDQFKYIVSPEHAPQTGTANQRVTTNQYVAPKQPVQQQKVERKPEQDDFTAAMSDLLNDGKPKKQSQQNNAPKTPAQKESMSVDDFFSDLLN